MRRYAAETTVSSGKSRAEIEDTLMRYGATGFLNGVTADRAIIAFEAKGRRIKFILPLPDRSAREFTHTRHENNWAQQQLSSEKAAERYEQGVRQRWRALALCIKAKLEAVESGIETFEEAFMAHIVLPNGQTMAEHALPLIADSYRDNKMPPLLGHDGTP